MSHLLAPTMRHWELYLPRAYAAIDDKEAFFQKLVDDAHQQIQDLAEALRGEDPADEPFMQKVGRYEMARANAEAQILREVLLLPAEADREVTEARRDAEGG